MNGRHASTMSGHDMSRFFFSEGEPSDSRLVKHFGTNEVGERMTAMTISMPTTNTKGRASPFPSFRKKEPLFIDKHKEKARSTAHQHLTTIVHELKKKMTQKFNLAQSAVNETLHYRIKLARATHDARTEEEIKLSHLLKLVKNSEDRVKQSLRPSRRSLKNRERLVEEQKELERRLRGILGRQPFPKRLEEEQEEKVDETFETSGKIAQIPGAAVESRDIVKLLPGQWLNDEVINFYLKLIEQRSDLAVQKRKEAKLAQARIHANMYDEAKDESHSLDCDLSLVKDVKKHWNGVWNVHVFNTFFFEKLKKQGYSGVRQWTRKVDIFTKDLILFPINVGQLHWVCAAINMRRCRFEYYDSMQEWPGERLFNLLRDYLASEYADKKQNQYGALSLHGWQRYFSQQSPIQNNGSDCGVFAVMTIEQLSRRDPWLGSLPPPLDAEQIVKQSAALSLIQDGFGAESHTGDSEDGTQAKGQPHSKYRQEELWNFSQEDMDYLRRRMVYEIVSKSLLE